MRKAYWLPCTCGQKLPVQTVQAGTLVRCPCGAELTVPTLHEMSSLESAATADTAGTRRRKVPWGRRQSRILLGAVVAAAAGMLLVYLQISQPRLPRVESLAPIQVWSLWQDLRRGPDRNLPPAEKQLVNNLWVYRTGKIVLLTCVVAGLLLMAVSYATPAPQVPPRASPN